VLGDNYISASQSASWIASCTSLDGWMELAVETTDAQARKLMEEFGKYGKVGVAALRSGMHRDSWDRHRCAVGRHVPRVSVG